MKPRRLHSDTSLSITSGWVLAAIGVDWSDEKRHRWMRCRPRSARPVTPRPEPENNSGVELRAQPRRRWNGAAEQPGHDPVPVKAAVLDEHLVGVVARHHYTGDEQSGNRRLEG